MAAPLLLRTPPPRSSARVSERERVSTRARALQRTPAAGKSPGQLAMPPVSTGVKLGGNPQQDPRFRKLLENLHQGAVSNGKPAVASAPSAARGGEPLPLPVQAAIGQSLQLDLKSVRVHTETPARSMARSLSARAVTHGSHIFLGPGERTTDLGLMAHEAAHVVQQQRSAPTPQLSAPGQGGVHEREADQASEAVLRGEPFRVREQASGSTSLAKRDAGPEPADVTAGGGTVLEVEGLLRALYDEADQAISQTAQRLIAEGRPVEEVARWANAARNEAKVRIRRWDLDVLRLLAEQRNLRKYENPVGPSYEKLRTGDARGITPKTDKQIIESAARANLKVNKWVGRLRIAGRILIAIDIGIASYRVATAGVEWPRVALQEGLGVAGAAAGGWAGAKLVGAIGAGIGTWFGGAGAIPGAAIGAFIGGVGGAIGVGWLGRKGGEALVDKLFPPQQTDIEGAFR
ncbi:MAG TPA: DUF4157 domain-containing protein [Archangium sp.]|uniref:eCIS core domain-containing protein n=1 Tax=Archangium sp. TaxID=1872627 RepID=UPI002E31FF2A|nr:DUF4157 domain-containing protein [Archangium sp.]HEX5749530.1 DUF4157 domain-containing protein [Archangium sp.]